jgi:hypothetical protein
MLLLLENYAIASYALLELRYDTLFIITLCSS